MTTIGSTARALSDARTSLKLTARKVALTVLGVLGVALLAAGLAVLAGFRRDMQTARATITAIPTEVYAPPYGDIEYRLAGEGPVVLVSHGVTGGVDQGMGVTKPLGQSYRFLYVSRFGYLRSSLSGNASARLQAAAYKDLLDHLGIEEAFVFGNSAGGPSAMWFAVDYPERTRGLILHSSAAPGPLPAFAPRPLFQYDFLYWAALKAMPDMVASFLIPADIRAAMTPQEHEFVRGAMIASLPISERSEGAIFDNEVSTPSVNEVPLELIESPTLILQAMDDRRERAGGQVLARRIPGSRLAGLAGGHFLLRQDERVREEVAAFIATHQ